MAEKKTTQPFQFQKMRGRIPAQSTIIAVGGGKGGVGKSFFSTNLAVFLAKIGHKTLLVDLDMDGANAHTYLGETPPQIGIHEFLSEEVGSFSDIIYKTKFTNLSLASCNSAKLDLDDIDLAKRSRLMSSVYHHKTDYIVLDLSAGASKSTLDYFLMAQKRLIVMTPDPSSIENAYRFMKAAFFRRIKRFEFQLGLTDDIASVMRECEKLELRSPGDLLRYIDKHFGERGLGLLEKMYELEMGIVLNQVRTQKDVHLGESVESVVKKYFNLPCYFLGHLNYDNAVWQALRRRSPLLLEFPQSHLYSQLLKITRDLIHPQTHRAVV